MRRMDSETGSTGGGELAGMYSLRERGGGADWGDRGGEDAAAGSGVFGGEAARPAGDAIRKGIQDGSQRGGGWLGGEGGRKESMK